MTALGPIQPGQFRNLSERSRSRPGWRVGQKVRAFVVRRLPGDRYLLRGDDAEWVAESEVELEEGEYVTGRVVRLEPVPTLKLSGQTENSNEEGGEQMSSSASEQFTMELNGEPFEVVALYRRESGRRRGRLAVHRLSMLLRNERLGVVGLDLSITGRYVTVEARCESLELAELLQEGSLVLERALNLDKLLLANFSVGLWEKVPPDEAELVESWGRYESIDWVT